MRGNEEGRTHSGGQGGGDREDRMGEGAGVPWASLPEGGGVCAAPPGTGQAVALGTLATHQHTCRLRFKCKQVTVCLV